MSEHDAVTGPNAKGGRGWIWVGVGSSLVTALVMFLIMRPGSLDATSEPRVTGHASPTPSSTTPAAIPASSTPSLEPTPQDPSWPILEDGWIFVSASLTTAEEVWTLEDAPAGFQEFAAPQLTGTDVDGCTPEISIIAMHPDGFVYGGEGFKDCGSGAAVIWSDSEGRWAPLFVTQDVLACADLSAARVPENIGELECIDGEQIRYW